MNENDMPQKDLTLTRTINASVVSTWEAWTVPELVKQWWPPNYFTSPSAVLDFKEGGKSIVCMRAPKEFGGRDTYTAWVYTKIVPLSRIEFINNLSDEEGTPIDPTTIGMAADFPRDMLMTAAFEDLGNDKTQLTVTQHGWHEGQMRSMAEAGLGQSLDKMVGLFA